MNVSQIMEGAYKYMGDSTVVKIARYNKPNIKRAEGRPKRR